MSQSTVSLVLSGKGRGRISAATEAAVRRAADELGYRPNAAARALRTGTARTVGLAVPDVTHPFFGRVLRGAQAAAWQAGYAVVLVDVARDRDWATASLEAVRARGVDGVLLFGGSPVGEAAVEGLPLVLVEAEGPPDVSSVRFDVEGGVRAVLDHLLGLGHRRIGHVAAQRVEPTFVAREAVWREALQRAGVDPAGLAVGVQRIELDGARDAGLALLAARPSAVFCDDDVLAAGVYLAARERGLRIPADLSVAGFDDLDVARVLDPPLTTVAADAEALGAAAFELLLGALADGPAEQRVLPVRFLARGSTGPRGGGG